MSATRRDDLEIFQHAHVIPDDLFDPAEEEYDWYNEEEESEEFDSDTEDDENPEENLEEEEPEEGHMGFLEHLNVGAPIEDS